jgi:hypothetical protein
LTLSDRLQQAKTQRLIKAGVLSSEHALKPERPSAPAIVDNEGAVYTPITIEVLPSGLHAVVETAGDLGEVHDIEAATVCPNCNGLAGLDLVDLVGHTMHYTCATCGAMWQSRTSTHNPITG